MAASRRGTACAGQALITDEILNQFAIVARWDDVADRMVERYKGIASRLVIYLASHFREVDSKNFECWARAARQADKAPHATTGEREVAAGEESFAEIGTQDAIETFNLLGRKFLAVILKVGCELFDLVERNRINPHAVRHALLV